MKTTLDISDPLLRAAKLAARRDRTTVRAIVEQGLRLALEARRKSIAFELPDAAVDGQGLRDGAQDLSWPQLRSLAYGDREG